MNRDYLKNLGEQLGKADEVEIGTTGEVRHPNGSGDHGNNKDHGHHYGQGGVKVHPGRTHGVD